MLNQTKLSGQFSALKGAITLAINDEEYSLKEDISSKIVGHDTSELFELIKKRIIMANHMLHECIQNTGMSQSALCDEIHCERAQFNRAMRWEESNTGGFPRAISYTAIEGLSNTLDINISKMFLGIDIPIALPRRYTVALSKIGGLADRKQAILIQKLRELSKDYLSVKNVMTADYSDTVSTEEFRLFIGRRCRFFTDENNMPPAYLIENTAVRRQFTNLFETLNNETPSFLGRIGTMMALCYTSNIAMEYFLIRDLSQERLINRISFFKDNPPTKQQLEALRIFCSTEQNPDLNNLLIATVLES